MYDPHEPQSAVQKNPSGSIIIKDLNESPKSHREVVGDKFEELGSALEDEPGYFDLLVCEEDEVTHEEVS
jgi:hypothetical protein